MPVTVSDTLLAKELELDFFARINESMNSALWRRISTLVTSAERTREYGWLGSSPSVREFNAERRPAGLGEFTYVIRNRKWEASIEVDNDDLRHYKRGDQVQIRIAQLADRFASHPNTYLFKTVLPAGESDNGYDGVPFFSDSHPVAGATQSNALTHSVGDPGALTPTEVEGIFNKAWVALMGMRDDQGEQAGESPKSLVLACAHTHVPVFNKLLNPAFGLLDGGTSRSVSHNDVTVYGTPNIPNDRIYLLNASDYIKPFVFQQVSEVEFGSDENFLTDFTVFGAKANYNFGYGDYKKAVLVSL